jgi:TRAP-type C4-dicarboxylate transport system permease small subunit
VKRLVERLLEIICMALLVILTVIVLVGITYRTFGNALVWYDEVAAILLAWLTYWGAALAALKRAHIGAPGFINSFGPPVRRAALVVSEILVLGFFVLLAWVGWQVFEVLEGSMMVSLPEVSEQWAQVIIPLGSVLFIIAELLSIPDAWRAAGGSGPAAAPHVSAKEVLSTE